MTPKEYILETGEVIKYDALHSRLRRKFGNALYCSNCNNKTAKRFEWALKSGKAYSLNINDYIQLCPSCHRHYDKCYGNIGNIVKGKSAHNCVRVANSIGQEFDSILIASKLSGISRTAICNNLAGISKVAGGLTWKRI